MPRQTNEPLDPMIHSPVRLAILSILISVESADFTYLKETIHVTDGNLSTHLSKLEGAGLISVEKSFRGKKPHTTFSITPEGRARFEKYVKALEKMIYPANK
ncbi:MAG: transcriptional regulator [Calditrichaeota bacterium]|nr:transcriptional regulator [Calditrichota bacterium]